MRSMMMTTAVLLSMNFVLGQDPTVPSPAIAERMSQQVALQPRAEFKPIPVVKLRAMVMGDRDHGTAIVEADGQRLQIRLDRTILKTTDPNSGGGSPLNRIQIQGVEYSVEDFSNRTIILTDSLRRVIVQ